MIKKPLEDDVEPGFTTRYRLLWIAGAILLVGAAWGLSKLVKKDTKPQRAQEFSMVRIVPPPPPSPPPPPPPPQKIEEREQPKQEMVEQEQVQEDEPPPQEQAPDEPPPGPDLSTDIVGNGPADGFGLGGPGSGGGGGSGFGGQGRRGGGSKYGWYASQVQTKIAEALRNNAKTSRAETRIEVRIWPDDSGRITRAKLGRSTGDKALDDTIENEVLTGLRLSSPPPADMPRPIVLRLTARRPN